MKQQKPIFFDAERVRWRRTSHVLEASGALLTLLLVYFFITIAVPVYLPAVLQQAGRPGYHPVLLKKSMKNPTVREGRKRRVARIGKVPDTYDPLRAAFFVSWDPASIASLKKHYKDIDLLIPEQLHAVTPNGTLTVMDYEQNQSFTASPKKALAILQGDKLHQWMKSAGVELPMMGLVNNFDGTVWRVKEMLAILADPAARRRLAEQLTQYAVEARQAGIVVDFEDIPPSSQRHFREFTAELGPSLHALGLKLMMTLPARNPEFDYGFFGGQCDAIILMDYDQHWQTSRAGPIAAQDWFMENLRRVREAVPSSKIVVAIANYAYDWPEPRPGKADSAAILTVQEALLRASESEAQMEFDGDSLNPHYSYSDDQHRVHQVWILDAVTAYNEMRASEQEGVQGTALWRLGSADTSLWPIWDATRPDDAIRSKLEVLPPGPDLILEGDGDVWRIVDTPKEGRRTFHYEASTDLITSETYETYPLSYDIERSGAVPGKIAISFDDGPDPSWTPKILEILREKKAPAVFFVIGDAAARSPGLLRQEYAEGHEIGNHTYTHPQFEDAPHAQLRIEVNLTQRLIESVLGVKSTYFRPPYGIDHQPEYAQEVAALPIPQEMGYVLVGAQIDAQDWRQPDGKNQVRAAEIVDGVLRQVKKGNIILFHDGGGDRSQTVAALPVVIDKLRAQGYRIVSVGELIGKTRAQVMIPLSPSEQFGARADAFVFGTYHWIRLSIAALFIAGILLVSGRALFIGILALVEKMRPDRAPLPNPPPTVSVLIPAYNEEEVIVDTVNSVLHSDLPGLQVIVVNDGSADRTAELLNEHFGAHSRVKVIHQVNRGKAAALSRAMAEADTEILITIDADTEVEPDAVSNLVRHFSHAEIGAMAGNVKVGNRTRWLTRWQALEYITSQNMEKRAFDLLNCITVVPGALGAWRKTAIEAAGGITADTVAEDADLTIAIRRLGWRIGYDEEAIAWTEAPETPGALARQRFRWTFGTLQSFWKHRDTLFRWKYGTLGWIALPNIFIFQLILPLLSPVIDGMFLGSVLLWGLAQFHMLRLPQIWTTADLEKSVLFFLGFLLIDMLTCVVAFLLERKEEWSLLVPVLLQRFYYRQMMYVVIFRSVKEAVSGRPVGWRGVEKEAPREIAHA
jgi:peptidoglycan-N-acetylglucosamine deacetylase